MYTPPTGNAIEFNFEGAYTPPGGGVLLFSWAEPQLLTVDGSGGILGGGLIDMSRGVVQEASAGVLAGGPLTVPLRVVSHMPSDGGIAGGLTDPPIRVIDLLATEGGIAGGLPAWSKSSSFLPGAGGISGGISFWNKIKESAPIVGGGLSGGRSEWIRLYIIDTTRNFRFLFPQDLINDIKAPSREIKSVGSDFLGEMMGKSPEPVGETCGKSDCYKVEMA